MFYGYITFMSCQKRQCIHLENPWVSFFPSRCPSAINANVTNGGHRCRLPVESGCWKLRDWASWVELRPVFRGWKLQTSWCFIPPNKKGYLGALGDLQMGPTLFRKKHCNRRSSPCIVMWRLQLHIYQLLSNFQMSIDLIIRWCYDSYFPMNICEFPSRLHLCPWRDAGNGGNGKWHDLWMGQAGRFQEYHQVLLLWNRTWLVIQTDNVMDTVIFCWLLFVKCSETTLKLLCFNTSSCSNFYKKGTSNGNPSRPDHAG